MSRKWWPILRVVGHSMEPALRQGRLLITLPAVWRPGRGDVVILDHPSGGRYVKRVAAVGGDEVELEAGRLRVNGRSFDGRARLEGAAVARWTVPADHLFVVGDNGMGSDDSRTWDQPYVPAASVRRAVRRRVGTVRTRAPDDPSWDLNSRVLLP